MSRERVVPALVFSGFALAFLVGTLAPLSWWMGDVWTIAPFVTAATLTAGGMGWAAGPRVTRAAGNAAFGWGAAVAVATWVIAFVGFVASDTTADASLFFQLVLDPGIWLTLVLFGALVAPIGAAAGWTARRWVRRGETG